MRSSLLSFLGGITFATGTFVLAGMQSGAPGTAISGDVREFLSSVRMVDMDDGMGGTVRTIRITGNVQIVNGTGQTGSTNGSGNLILGYAEQPAFGVARRGGSHNLMLGLGNSYQSTACGGIVAGTNNELAQLGSSILGGQGNVTFGPLSVIVAGHENETASFGGNAAILGGKSNKTAALNATVSGGEDGNAAGECSSVSGGLQHTALGPHDWRAGSLFEDQ